MASNKGIKPVGPYARWLDFTAARQSFRQAEQKAGGVWEFCWLTVPVDTPEDRIAFVAPMFRNKFGSLLEAKGFTVLTMVGPTRETAPVQDDPDRKRYRIWAFVRRLPVLMHMDVPDNQVAEMMKLGLKLNE